MFRVTLVNAWHDDNKGDSAIVIGTLSVLHEVLGDQARFALVAEGVTDERELANAYRHVLRAVGPLEMAPRLLPAMRPARGRAGLYLSAAAYLCRFVSASLTLTRRCIPGARLIAESSLVISKGGHKLHARKANPIHLANLYSHLAPLILARHHGVPFVLWGHSLGPFNSRVARWLTRRVLKNAWCVGVRESLSYELALQLGLPPEIVVQIPDPAFMIIPKLTQRVEQLMAHHMLTPGEFLALTVRQWGPPNSKRYQRYLDNVSMVVRNLLQADFAKRVAIVVHTQGPIPSENDAVASEQLLARLADLPVCLLHDDLTPAELCAFYGQSKLLLGTRFHSVILAQAGGAPACAISYFGPKSLGIMRDLGLSDWVVPLEQINPPQLEAQILAADLSQLRHHLQHAVAQMRQAFRTATYQLISQIRNAPTRYSLSVLYHKFTFTPLL